MGREFSLLLPSFYDGDPRATSSRNFKRCTFPEGPLGKSSKKNTRSGDLNAPKTSRQCPNKAASSTHPPSRSLTQAHTRLPVPSRFHAERRRLQHIPLQQQRLVNLARRDVLSSLDNQLFPSQKYNPPRPYAPNLPLLVKRFFPLYYKESENFITLSPCVLLVEQGGATGAVTLCVQDILQENRSWREKAS